MLLPPSESPAIPPSSPRFVPHRFLPAPPPALPTSLNNSLSGWPAFPVPHNSPPLGLAPPPPQSGFPPPAVQTIRADMPLCRNPLRSHSIAPPLAPAPPPSTE